MMFVKHIFVFFGYAMFILYLLFTGEITRFISPRFIWLIYLSGLSLGMFYLALSMRDQTNRHSHTHKKPLFIEIAKGIMLIYPLLLFFIIKPSDISSLNIPAVKAIPAKKALNKEMPSSLPTDSEGYVRLNLFELWLVARNYPELAQRYKFKTSGMIADISEKYITLSRFFMTCCAADATAVEVDVIVKNAVEFNKGDWLQITGSIIIKEHVIVVPDNIVSSQKPPETYITRWSEEPPFNP